jgi:uncharacterized membrane protein
VATLRDVAAILVWTGLIAGFAAAGAALYGRYRTLPAALTGPMVCKLDDANGCQVLFRTRNAALLGVPNGLLGIACYVSIAIGLVRGWPTALLLAGASAALTMSVYLAYVLIRDRLECRVCWTGHFANAVLWIGLALTLLNAKAGQL